MPELCKSSSQTESISNKGEADFRAPPKGPLKKAPDVCIYIPTLGPRGGGKDSDESKWLTLNLSQPWKRCGRTQWMYTYIHIPKSHGSNLVFG